MRIVEPKHEILYMPDNEFIIRHLELAARTCYKSEDQIKEGSGEVLLKRITKMGHESVIEHAGASVHLVCDRGITHELVRHRLMSFSQSSSRYANFSKDKFGNEITVIRPYFWENDPYKFKVWRTAMESCEKAYMDLVHDGATAQEARSVLPNSLEADIVITGNFRNWKHFFNLRCDTPAHPQMREITIPLLKDFYERCPILFENEYNKFCK